MRIVIAAVGRLKQGPERELAERYRKRALDAGRKLGLSAVDIVEIKESRARDAARRMLEESIAIANIIPDGAVIAILDQRGENMSSGVLAARRVRQGQIGFQAPPTGLRPVCVKKQTWPLALARRPGRISLFASCFWSRFTAPSRF